MDCQIVRDDLHVEPTSAAVQAHIGSCARCSNYVARMARLDRVLRGELVASAPATLSAQLAALPNTSTPGRSRLETVVRDELVVLAPAELSARLRALVPERQAERSRVQAPVDVVLRDALVLQAPADLSARLQTLVPQRAAEVPAMAPTPVIAPPVAAARPRPWVVATVYFVTSALLLVSLFYAGQVYSLVAAQLGLEQWLAEIAALPTTLLNQLYAYVPQARAAVGVLVRLQQPLQWMLVTLVLWAVVDMSQRQRQGYAEAPRRYA